MIVTTSFVILIFSLYWSNAQLHSHPVLPIGYPCHAVPPQEKMSDDFHCFENLTRCKGVERNRYRSIDGICNNLSRAKWGATGSEFQRLLNKRTFKLPGPEMDFYLSSNGHKLPNARLASSVVHGTADGDPKSTEMSLLVMQIGQFLDHDISLTPESDSCTQCGQEPFKCCDYLNYTTNEGRPAMCWPIPVPENDPIFRSADLLAPMCLEFKRSQRSRCVGQDLFNEITHFVDASNVYGSTGSTYKLLRAGIRGLFSGNQTGQSFLLQDDKVDNCSNTTGSNFLAGDVRVNENPGLSTLHTLWAREHNRLARLIKAAAPHKQDSLVMEEARRYVVATWQNVIYGEFLPTILTSSAMDQYNLGVGGSTGSLYDKLVDPSLSVEFSTAAFRFGHSLVSSIMEIYSKRDGPEMPTLEPLEEHFFDTSLVRKERQLGLLFKSMATQRAQKPDATLANSVRNKLFKDHNHTFGNDLAALNIQRGRDHEIGGYGEARSFCGLQSLPDDFRVDKKPLEFTDSAWERLSRVYQAPEDIELFPGGLSETVLSGGALGPTFTCIVGLQFHKLKFGDRFFFTHTNIEDAVQFCANDVSQIRKRKLRDVICDNTDMVKLALDPFRVPSSSNPELDCHTNVNRLHPDQLCLFGGPANSNLLHSPGYITNDIKGDGDKEVIAVAGGFDGGEVLSSSEVYDPQGSCNFLLTPLPEQNYGLFMVFMYGKLYACGGSAGNKRQCWWYERSTWNHDQELELNRPRLMSAHAVSPQGIVYVGGGFEAEDSLEYLDKYTHKWVLVGSVKRVRHCMVALPNERLVTLGGFKQGHLVELFDPQIEEWVAIKSVKTYSDKHSCKLIPKYSEDEDDQILIVSYLVNSQNYNVKKGTTSESGITYLDRTYSSLAIANSKLYAIGGEYHQSLVEEFDKRTKTFHVLDQSLIYGRSRFGCATVPKSYFQDTQGLCNG